VKSRGLLAAALFWSLVPSAAAADRYSFTKAQTANVDNALANRDLAGAYEKAIDNCIAHRDEALKGKSIAVRVEQSRLYLDCVQSWRGYVAATSNYGTANVRDLFQPGIAEAERLEKKATSEQDFMGMTFGVGLGFSVTNSDAIDGAEVVGGKVTVTSSKKQQPRVFLEFHQYIEGWCTGANQSGTIKRGCGPFMAVSASSDNVLQGVGFGWMYGFKPKEDTKEGFSIGLGAMLDSKVKTLASGFTKNEAPPAGEMTVRFEEKARWSAILFFTRTF
jgi:hypothetical protein